MTLFHLIPDAKAITRDHKGVYRQVDLYDYKGRIFLKQGNGFCWILKSHDQLVTSMENVNVDELVIPFAQEFNGKGYLTLPKDYSENK